MIGCGIVGLNAGDRVAEACLAIEMGTDAHDIGGLLAFASLNRAYWDLVPAFPQTLTTMVFGHSSLRWLEISS